MVSHAAPAPLGRLSAPTGHVLPGSVDELWSMGKEALQAGDDKKALHHLTMAVNSAAKKMPRNKERRERGACPRGSGGRRPWRLHGRWWEAAGCPHSIARPWAAVARSAP